MSLSRACLAIIGLAFLQPAARAAEGAPHPGKALYERHCASCHDKPDVSRAVPFAQLRTMRLGNLFFAMTDGKMKAQAAPLNERQRGELVDFIVDRQPVDERWMDAMRCGPRSASKPVTAGAATVQGFGFTRDNMRRLTRDQAGLATADVPGLELAWALAFPRASTMRSQAAVVGNMLYLPVGDEARVFAIDTSGEAPCFAWVYESSVPLRTGAAYGVLASGQPVLAFADAAVNVHLLDARNGKLLWRYETMPDAKPVRDRGDGRMMQGPSGAPIWSSPAMDVRRGLIYVGTGEATSAPAADTIDSVLALDMRTGKLRWKFQATPDDIFLTSCLSRPQGLNCPREGRMLDVDFGASPILAHRTDGTDVLLAGQKSGTLWALDPDSGKLLWNREFGKGSPLGGIHWGMAADARSVFVPIHKLPDANGDDANQTPGLHAVNLATCEVRWSFTAVPDCTGDRRARVPTCGANIGLSGAPTVIDGAVF